MKTTRITVEALINADKNKVWDYYNNPKHIVNWNFADPSWHCPSATNDLKVGGTYKARMEAKDGSYGFDFEAVYSEIIEGESFTYEFGGRQASVHFKPQNGQTKVVVSFDAESQNSVEMQQQGWQSILNNFKKYTEAH